MQRYIHVDLLKSSSKERCSDCGCEIKDNESGASSELVTMPKKQYHEMLELILLLEYRLVQEEYIQSIEKSKQAQVDLKVTEYIMKQKGIEIPKSS